MTGQDFINLLILKNKAHLNFSNKKEVLDSFEELFFKDLKNKELKIFEEEYSDFNKAPYVLYYLINEVSWLKDKDLDVISSYISMTQLKTDNDLKKAKKGEFGFELLGSSRKILGTGVLAPIKESYESDTTPCLTPEYAEEFLKTHPGYYIGIENSLDAPESFTKEEMEIINRLEQI